MPEAGQQEDDLMVGKRHRGDCFGFSRPIRGP